MKFPFELDVFQCCTPELQEKLKPGRTRIKELMDIQAETRKNKKKEDTDPKEKKREHKDHHHSVNHATRQVLYEKLGIEHGLAQDIGANVSGWYDLVAVLTHVGRTAESGHYIGWVKDQNGEWWKFDDDKVSPVTEEEIQKLEGGGDWHSAYICLYRSKSLEE